MNSSIEQCSWQQLKSHFETANPIFSQLVDDIKLSDHFPLLHVTYSYGAFIVEEGSVQLPLRSGGTAPLSHSEHHHLSSQLDYAAIPVGLLANRASEVFVRTENRTIPLKLLHPGTFFGLFELCNALHDICQNPIWDVTSGCRTLFMLPSIAENASHGKLVRHFRLPFDVPKYPSEHWRVFTHLANQATPDKRWHSEVIFLTRAWYEKLKNPPNIQWQRLAYYLGKEAWRALQYTQNDTEFSLVWQKFSEHIAKRNLKPRPYLISTIKHLINIANGSMPGFKPASDDEAIAPLDIIRTAYKNVYQLKRYIPTLMHPENLMDSRDDILYYSLSFPTLLGDSYLMSRNNPNIIADERDLKLMMEMLCEIINSSALLPNSPLKNIKFEFYHLEEDSYGQINSSAQLFQNDPNFQYDLTHFPEKILCTNGLFCRGCVKIVRSSK